MTLEEAFCILRLPRTAKFSELRRAYLRLARIHHPDLHQQSGQAIPEAEERMKLLNTAYATLAAALDPSRRSKSRPSTDPEYHASRGGRQTALSRFRALWIRGVRLDLAKDNLADYAFGVFIFALIVSGTVYAGHLALESSFWIPVFLFDLVFAVGYVIDAVRSFVPDPVEDRKRADSRH